MLLLDAFLTKHHLGEHEDGDVGQHYYLQKHKLKSIIVPLGTKNVTFVCLLQAFRITT